MTSLLLLACVAACPLAMGTMMLLMRRGRDRQDEGKRGAD